MMTREELEQLKELITDVELKAIVFGRAAERCDLNDVYTRAPSYEKYRDAKHAEWSKAANTMYDFMEGLVK